MMGSYDTLVKEFDNDAEAYMGSYDPVSYTHLLVSGMLPLLKPGVLVTDVGSVKGCVHQSVGSALTETCLLYTSRCV